MGIPLTYLERVNEVDGFLEVEGRHRHKLAPAGTSYACHLVGHLVSRERGDKDCKGKLKVARMDREQ